MSEGLYDEDGIDGPFERRLERAMKADGRKLRQAELATFLGAAKYLAKHWPAYWIVMDSWPEELKRSVQILKAEGRG